MILGWIFPGMNERDKVACALIARYHTKALPGRVQAPPVCRAQPQKTQSGGVAGGYTAGGRRPRQQPYQCRPEVASANKRRRVILHLNTKGDCWAGFPMNTLTQTRRRSRLGALLVVLLLVAMREAPANAQAVPPPPQGTATEEKGKSADLAGLLRPSHRAARQDTCLVGRRSLDGHSGDLRDQGGQHGRPLGGGGFRHHQRDDPPQRRHLHSRSPADGAGHRRGAHQRQHMGNLGHAVSTVSSPTSCSC